MRYRMTLEAKVGGAWMTVECHEFDGPKDSSLPVPAVAGNKTKPSLPDVLSYAESIGLGPQDAEAFFDYFEANGWRVCQGKAMMRDWRAALRNWLRNSKKSSHLPANLSRKPGVAGIFGGI